VSSHHRITRIARGASLVALLGACSTDRTTAPTSRLTSRDASANESQGRGVFQRYVAIGTSVSMGWASDGVIAATQLTSWPAQLAAMAGRDLSQPYIAGTGCRSPLVAPLLTFLRLSGESAAADPATLSCSPLRADVTLPVSNVSISGALTQDALFTTPDNVTDPVYAQLYHRVLQPGSTQVSTMMALNPKLVSVELGAAEVLRARSGIAIPGVTVVSLPAWQALYDQVLDSVQKVSKMAVLVGLASDANTFPAFRRGAELWDDRLEFALFNVAVSPDCTGSANLLFVPIRVELAVATGLQLAAQHLGPYTLSCAAGGPLDPDLVLTPTELAIVNAEVLAMNSHIQSEAVRRGFAYFDLGALYGRSDLKPPFSVITMMTTAAPYGPFISLDGVHPSATGSAVLAHAAAIALNTTYQLGLPE
jgi:hypothetical protein